MWIQDAQGKTLTSWITFAAGTGFALFGYDQGVFGAVITNESFVKTFNNPSPTLQGHITATYDLGCFVGAILTMWQGNKYGNRRIILMGSIILVIGAILQTAAYHVPQMIIGRFVAGIGNGMNTASIPVWQSETVAAKHRGHVMVLQLAVNQVGNVTSQWINYGMTFIASNSVAWRFPLAFQVFYAFLTILLVPFLPDSPRWLVLKNRNDEALEVIRRLGGSRCSEEESRERCTAIQQSVEHEMSMGKLTIKSLLKRDSLHTTRRILLGAGTQFMQQWCGINAILYYLPVVFASLGLDRNLSVILSCCNAMNLLISTCVGALYVERAGRKKMMFWGAIGQSLCYALVAIGLALGGKQWESVAVTFVFGFMTAFGLSWIAVPWMYPAEINTQRMRIAGAGIATATNWITNYAVVLITPIGIANIGWRYYILYAVLNAAFVPIVQIFYVETAGKSLEDIDRLFEGVPADSPASHNNSGSEEEKEVSVAHVDDA